MKIVIQNPIKAECFTNIFQNMKLFTDKVNIMFMKDKMYMQTMDNSHVSIIEISIPSTWFDTYKNENSVNIGINTQILFKILSTRDKCQLIELDFNEDESDRLFINFTNEIDKSIYDKHFEMPLMDIDSDNLGIPDIEFQAKFTLTSFHFSNLVNQLKMFGDTIVVECNEENIILNAHQPETGKMSVEIKNDDLNYYEIEENKKLKVSFSINYLYNICSFHKISKDVELNISEDYPMKVVYYLGQDDAKLSFYLAPKVDCDE